MSFQVPFTSAIFIHPSWPWGEIICKLSEFFKDLSIGVSVFTLTALSGDRFFAIVDPLRKFHSHSGRRATRITIGIALLIWILAGLMGIPALKASYVKVCKQKLAKLWLSDSVEYFCASR
jgi:bombesin receptor subtype-3